MVEEGRFITRPDQNGNPSRTSVSLSGDVAVANRSGGLSKIYADDANCGDTNGMPGIQTSTDNQYLAWDVEECRAWYAQMNYMSQRPAAWAPGEWNDKACGYEDEPVWTSGTNGSTIDVVLLDGDDGAIIDTVNLGNSVTPSYFGLYGGAVDGDGNFWGSQLGQGKLVRVMIDDMTFEVWPMAAGGYGMTVDSDGYVWTCSSQAARFDPNSETWQVNSVGGSSGCMAETGEDGLLWMANGSGIVGVNRQTLQVAKTCANTNGSYGISIDFQGRVWAVAYGSNANRVDPETCQYQTYSGLVGAYTYSDMTGYAVANAGTPSG
jgi:streptogramin lyase